MRFRGLDILHRGWGFPVWFRRWFVTVYLPCGGCGVMQSSPYSHVVESLEHVRRLPYLLADDENGRRVLENPVVCRLCGQRTTHGDFVYRGRFVTKEYVGYAGCSWQGKVGSGAKQADQRSSG